ncbi:hypothetical protein TUM17386_06190 [Shewanella algae]|nr:hypothetical protein TUM17386_06190 [Shewanella algae]
MIYVSVSQKNILQLQAVLRQGIHDALMVTAWIYHSGFATLLTPDEAAILLERGHWDDLVFHYTHSQAVIVP